MFAPWLHVQREAESRSLPLRWLAALCRRLGSARHDGSLFGLLEDSSRVHMSEVLMTATQALVALVVACAAIVAGVALLSTVAWALIIGGSLLFVVVVVLYDSQLNQRRADQMRAGRREGP